MKTGMLVLVGMMTTVSCGRAPQGSSTKELAAATESAKVKKFAGTNEQGAVCNLELQIDDTKTLKSLHLSGTYTVDYKIPAPLSGLYGKYFYPGQFDSHTSINASELKIGQAWLSNNVVVEGKGKPLFWDTPEDYHKVTVHGGLDHPESATYHSSHRLVAVVPFIETDLVCKDLKAVD